MSSEQKCSQCLEHFSLLNPPRSMPSCQHNICTKCLKQVIQHRHDFIDCQFCAKKIKRKEIKLFPKNLKLLQKIKLNNTAVSSFKSSAEKANKSFRTNRQSQQSKQNPLQQQCVKYQQDELLLLNTDYQLSMIEKQSNYVNIYSQYNQTTCQIHKKPLDVICATEKKKICAHCAIFGNHKDHRFKTILQFNQEIQDKTMNFSNILIKRQEIQKQKSLTNIKINANLKIESRKQLLLKQIQKSFQQLITLVRKNQRMLQKQLEEKFELAKSKINQNLLNETKLKKNYLNWQRSCQDTINRLKMTKSIQNKVQIYYDSPLEICQQGQLYLQEMTKNLSEILIDADQQINSISLKTQQRSFDGYLSLVFPILEQSSLSKQLQKINQQFQKDYPNLKTMPVTQEDLNQNSFIFDTEVSAIQMKQPKSQKRGQYKLNRSSTSINSLNSLTNLSVLTNQQKFKFHKNDKNDEKLKIKTSLNRIRVGQKRFGSPDFTKGSNSKIIKPNKTPQQILIELSLNDFINEVDLSELSLSDKQILQFLKKAKNIRPLKAIKLQKNNLTDQGFDSICQYLQHVFNLNISFNNLTEKCLDSVIKNKEYLYKMRIINISHNQISSDRTDVKIKGKLEEIKRMGLMITL